MKNVKPTVAKLNCGNEQGTAFLITKNLALTMSHCVQEALDDNKKIYLTFKNISGEDEIERVATILKYKDEFPVSILKIENEIDDINPLGMVYFDNQISRGTRLLAYGYAKVKGEEGCIVDLTIDDYLNENVLNDADINLKIFPNTRMSNFSGMSGSPVIYKNSVIGILAEQTNEISEFESKAIELKMISIKKIKELLDNFEINYTKESCKVSQDVVEKSKDIRSYLENDTDSDEKRKVYKDNFIIDSPEVIEILEDYEELIDSALKKIILTKNKGDMKGAWDNLDKLIEKVRGSNSKSSKILERLYYQKACWYLDDYEDCKNAKKYLKKVLKLNSEFDYRNYNAKKFIIEGEFSKAKQSLLPIDNVFVLNTYLQVCTYNGDIDDAFSVFGKNESIANETTYYLMSLISILDKDYEMAYRYLSKSDESNKDFPLYIMMKGVIKYWKILPESMTCDDDLLPPMYVSSMVLLNDEMKQEMKEIGSFYKQAYDLACIHGNIQLQKQILCICLNTFSISDEYRKVCYIIADKLMKLEDYQCQAVIYYCATGKEIMLKDDFDPEKIVQKKGKNIATMISCIYLYINKKDFLTAYRKLKEYRFKFDEVNMMTYWFELLIRCCDDQKTLREEHAKLNAFNMSETDKKRINIMFLSALGENEEIIDHELKLYKETNSEIDLINLINCFERCKDWEKVEFYSKEWKRVFCNLKATIKIVRSLALQNKQEECLNVINEIRSKSQDECLVNEVLFYEVQALKLLGKYDEAIEKGNLLWKKETNYKIIILLSECYYLNLQEEKARFVLLKGIEDEIQNVQVYQLYAEYNKEVDKFVAEKYVNESVKLSNDDPDVKMWAMNFLYSIGKSDKANELLLDLKSFGEIESFREVSFKEAKELLEKANIESKERYEKYEKCLVPYHVYFDLSKNASYTLFSHQLWNRNADSQRNKQFLLTNFGGHIVDIQEMRKSFGKSITIDFSSLVHLKHFELLDEIKEFWNKIIISGNFRHIIALEQDLCFPNQPDILKEKEKMMNMWKNKSIYYIDFPSQKDIKKWLKTEINIADIVPYEVAKRENLVLISDDFTSDLLEESHKISDEMRNNVISIYELLTILEKRGEISENLKSQYTNCNVFRKENKLISTLIEKKDKLSIFVDENFLREIFKINGVSIISQKCNIYVFNGIFESIESEIKETKNAKKAFEFLEELKNKIQELRNDGYIGYYGVCENSVKREGKMLTNDLKDLIHYASSKNQIIVCDDRWLNSFGSIEGCSICSIIDVVESLHEKNIISNEKYVSIITQMFKEGYAYIIPPYEYIRLLIEQIDDKNNINIYQNIPEELTIMCEYLVHITASENKLNNQAIHPNQFPESVNYMYKLQRISINIMEYIWSTERSVLWKKQVSNWVIANYSVFTYQTNLNESFNNINKKYYEFELANYLLLGFHKYRTDFCSKEYYNWLFNCLYRNAQWKNGLEDRMMKMLIDKICSMYNSEVDIPNKDAGISMIIYAVINSMPEYYQKLIMNDELIKQKMSEIENNLVYLDDGNFVLRSRFNQLIEDVMKQEIGSSIVFEIETNEYRITFISSELFYQLFKCEYVDKNENKKEIDFIIEQALLLSKDVFLRKEGLQCLENFITGSQMESYINKINSKNWDSLVQNIRTEIMSKEEYFIYIVNTFFECKTQIFTLNNMFSISLNLFKIILYNNTQDDLIIKEKRWLQDYDKNVVELFVLLLVFVFNSLKENDEYSSYTENDISLVACYLTDLVMNQIIHLDKIKKLKIPITVFLNNLKELNVNLGYLDKYKNLEPLNKEKNNYEVEKYFKETDLRQVTGNQLENICKKMYFYNGIELKKYLVMIKNWIKNSWKKECVDEKQTLIIMWHYSYLKCKDCPQKRIDTYIGLWDNILKEKLKIHLSTSTVYALRSMMINFGLENGVKMRKIVEEIML